MSEQNVELHRRAVEAFHARNVDAFIACLDPTVEYHSAITVPGGAVYQGHDGIRKYFADFKDAWGDEFRVEPEAYFDLGEETLMFTSCADADKRAVRMSRCQGHRYARGVRV